MADLLGRPNEGFHKHFFGIPIGDVIGTIVVCWGLSWYFNWTFWKVLLIAFVLGEVLHWIFGVKTAFLKWITSI
jgi:hypothetical protein